MLGVARLGAQALAEVELLTARGTDSAPTPVMSGGGGISAPTSNLIEAQAILTPTLTPTVGAPATQANRPSLVATQATDCNACADVPLSSVRLDTMGLPYAWEPNCVEATPYDKSQPPGPMGLPQHLQVNLRNVDSKDVKPGDP